MERERAREGNHFPFIRVSGLLRFRVSVWKGRALELHVLIVPGGFTQPPPNFNPIPITAQ